MSPTTNSSRWSPTSDQLMILEEMYRGGIRTPNASQIQQITAHLSVYGKIEGKNVFYWFQNHKARDRQKLRRKLSKQLEQNQQQPCQRNDQLQYKLDQHNHRFLHHLEPRSYFGTQQLFCDSNGCLLQGGNANAGALDTDTNMEKKIDIISERVEMEKAVMGMYGYDWMIMKLNMDPPHSPGPIKPLKTLQLFPITSSDLKDECTTSNSA